MSVNEMSQECSSCHTDDLRGPVHACSTCGKPYCWHCYWKHKQHCTAKEPHGTT